jgi:CheY-like chemotaxis protein
MIVVVVDPNAEARAPKLACLRKTGATLHEAADAESAVAIAQDLPQLDVLVTEWWLSEEFSGFDLRDAVRQRFPEVRTVFTSRYDLSQHDAEVGGCPVLYDPVNEESLLDAVSLTRPAAEADAAPMMVEDKSPGAGETPPAQVVEEEDAPPVLAAGTLLGSYEIQERLYAERDTETYLAVQEHIGRKVALGLLKPELVPDAAEVVKFKERERV